MTSDSVPEIRPGWTCERRCLDTAEVTFIQVARAMSFDGTSLVLTDLSPTVSYVAASAPTVLGHISTGAFLDLWSSSQEPAVLASSRPAVLSLADPDRSPLGDAVVRLTRPRIHDTGLTYDVTLVEGTLPSSSGSCVLYVNATVGSEADEVGRGDEPGRGPR
jgi:hypothetical protein